MLPTSMVNIGEEQQMIVIRMSPDSPDTFQKEGLHKIAGAGVRRPVGHQNQFRKEQIYYTQR